MNPIDEVTWIAECQRDDGRYGSQCSFESFFIQKRYYVVDGEGTAGELPHASYLPLDALGRKNDRLDATFTALAPLCETSG